MASTSDAKGCKTTKQGTRSARRASPGAPPELGGQTPLAGEGGQLGDLQEGVRPGDRAGEGMVERPLGSSQQPRRLGGQGPGIRGLAWRGAGC